eukprot:8376-Heterococcus_DN1.PRE.4
MRPGLHAFKYAVGTTQTLLCKRHRCVCAASHRSSSSIVQRTAVHQYCSAALRAADGHNVLLLPLLLLLLLGQHNATVADSRHAAPVYKLHPTL